MSQKGKRSSREVWEAMMAAPAADEAERIAALSEGELDAELRAHGLDPDKLRKEGERLGRELAEKREKGGNGGADHAPRDRFPARGWFHAHRFALVGVAAAASAAAFGVGQLLSGPGIDIVAHGQDAGAAKARAREQRAQANEACARQDWPRCQELLDEARDLDPEGDKQDPEVGKMRRMLEQTAAPADAR